MNTLTYVSTLCLLILISLAGCKQAPPEIGEPLSKLEGINDTWQLSKVIQVDKLTLSFDSTYDISAVFVGDEPSTISFNSTDFTYTTDHKKGPDYLGSGGKWTFENPSLSEQSQKDEYPTQILLTPTGADQITLILLRTVRTSDKQLEFQFVRRCRETNCIGYNYIFTRQ